MSKYEKEHKITRKVGNFSVTYPLGPGEVSFPADMYAAKTSQIIEESKDLDAEIMDCLTEDFLDLLAETGETAKSESEVEEKLRTKLQEYAEKNPNWLPDLIENLSQDDFERLEALENRVEELESMLKTTADASTTLANAQLAWMERSLRYSLRISIYIAVLTLIALTQFIYWMLQP